MNLFVRWKERIALNILMRSKNITMLAFKDVQLDQIFISADPTDPLAVAFYVQNSDQGDIEAEDPASMILERIYHSPSANKDP